MQAGHTRSTPKKSSGNAANHRVPAATVTWSNQPCKAFNIMLPLAKECRCCAQQAAKRKQGHTLQPAVSKWLGRGPRPPHLLL